MKFTLIAALVFVAALAHAQGLSSAIGLPPVGPPAPTKVQPPMVSLTTGGAPVPSEILSDPRLSGIGIRGTWPAVQPAQSGLYDFSYFSAELARVPADKWVLFRISSGGANTPSWVVPALPTFTWTDEDGVTRTIPVWWDPNMVNAKKAMIQKAGQLFGANLKIKYVVASCVNAITDDWNMVTAEASQWLQLGYTPTKAVNACKVIITTTRQAFPRAIMTMAIGRNGSLGPDLDYVARTVADWALATYPGRFIVQRNNLSAKAPDPAVTPPSLPFGWQVLYDRPRALQMLWWVTDEPTCWMNDYVAPCDEVAVMRDAWLTGSHYSPKYIEVYGKDIQNPEFAPIWATP